jgi:hydrogenase maturation protein HypF
VERLSRQDFHVYRHRRIPPNDGGLCVGQLTIAAARDAAGIAA